MYLVCHFTISLQFTLTGCRMRIASEISLLKCEEGRQRPWSCGRRRCHKCHSRARRVKYQVSQMLSLEGVECDWLLTVNPYNSFLGGKLLLVRRTTIMTLMRLGPQVYKNASWYIKNAYWVLTEMCIVNVSPMNARQMMYITVAQVQEIVVDLHTLQCGNIPATCRLEIFTFLIKSRHRCLLQFEICWQ